MSKKINKNTEQDKLSILEEKLENFLAFSNKMSFINPDYEVYCSGGDVYMCHVKRVVKEIIDIINEIKLGKDKTWSAKFFDRELKENESV